MGHGTVPKCGGTNRQGGPCGNPAGKGTDHFGSGNCESHCGSTPSGKAAALNDRAGRLLYKHDAEPVTNPLEALQRLAGRFAHAEEVIGDTVNELHSWRYEGKESGEQLRAEIGMLERAMSQLGRLLVDIAKLNIEERLAAVREKTAVMLEEALAAALMKSGANLEGQAAAREEFKRRLRVVA